MSMTMEGVVVNVEARQIKAGTPEARTIYDVVDGQGVKWTAWERDTAEQAFKLRGQSALWLVEVKQNGSYTNRTLKGIQAKATSGFAPALDAMEAQVGSVDPATFSALPGVQTGFPTEAARPTFVEEPTYRDRNIWRQTATKVAAHLSSGTPLDFWSNVDDLVKFYETGEKPASVAMLLGSRTEDPFSDLQQPPGADDGIPF